MTVKISSIGLKGLEGYRVQVEVQVSKGKESMVIVGLPKGLVTVTPRKILFHKMFHIRNSNREGQGKAPRSSIK